jgi:hypothetical protein
MSTGILNPSLFTENSFFPLPGKNNIHPFALIGPGHNLVRRKSKKKANGAIV